MKTLLAFLAFLSAHSSYPAPELLNRAELYCLAQAVHWEARGEPMQGKNAVAAVILNRARSPRFPDKICDVVYQPSQFTGLKPSYKPREGQPWRDSVEAAVLTYIGFLDDPTNGALWYYAHEKVTPWWASHKVASAEIGGHTFMRKGAQ